MHEILASLEGKNKTLNMIVIIILMVEFKAGQIFKLS